MASLGALQSLAAGSGAGLNMGSLAGTCPQLHHCRLSILWRRLLVNEDVVGAYDVLLTGIIRHSLFICHRKRDLIIVVSHRSWWVNCDSSWFLMQRFRCSVLIIRLKSAFGRAWILLQCFWSLFFFFCKQIFDFLHSQVSKKSEIKIK